MHYDTYVFLNTLIVCLLVKSHQSYYTIIQEMSMTMQLGLNASAQPYSSLRLKHQLPPNVCVTQTAVSLVSEKLLKYLHFSFAY